MEDPITIPRWGKVAMGGALLSISLAAGALGLVLNVAHGLEAGLAPGIAFGLADGAKILIPLVAGVIGWTRQTKITAAICVAVSLWSAINVYLDGAGRDLLAKQHGATAYVSQAETIAELKQQKASYEALAAAEAKKGRCGTNCVALTKQAQDASAKLQDARTKQATMAPVEISGLAATVAMAAGGRQESIGRGVAAIRAFLFLALIEGLVWLSVPAMRLLMAVSPKPRPIEPGPTKKAKPKAIRKKKPKQLTYQPAITAKVDGRTIAGRRKKLANDDANFVPAIVRT